MRLLPESSRLPEWESEPTLCSVLHRKGFVLRSGSRRTRWALTPPFHPYPAQAGRYIFCDTVRHLELASEMPALSHGMLLSWCSDFPLPHPFLGTAAIAYLRHHFKLSTVFCKSLGRTSPTASRETRETPKMAGFGLPSLPIENRGQ